MLDLSLSIRNNDKWLNFHSYTLMSTLMMNYIFSLSNMWPTKDEPSSESKVFTFTAKSSSKLIKQANGLYSLCKDLHVTSK